MLKHDPIVRGLVPIEITDPSQDRMIRVAIEFEIADVDAGAVPEGGAGRDVSIQLSTRTQYRGWFDSGGCQESQTF